ncbi:MAG: PRD domain-containing protein [Lachnospiraceae bacterium]|nr:PRD domain-containing protein [Lachnospiraceae bacterium]
MLQDNLWELLQLLSTADYMTAGELAEQLKLSERTVRMRLKELDDALRQYGAVIESKPRFGSLLVIRDREKYEELKKSSKPSEEERIPNTFRDRVNFLLTYLIGQESYVKMDDLCEFLYVSKGTLTAVLKRVEAIFETYHISIERRPNYGIRALGSELDFRRCLGEFLIRREALKPMGEKRQKKEIAELAEIVLKNLQNYKIRFSETAFENFVYHLYVARKRIGRGRYVQMDTMDVQMLEIVNQVFHVDLRSDFDLRMSLNQHMVPFDIRMRFDIYLENPVLDEIKENYMMGYRMASVAAAVLADSYKKEIPEGEIGYFALLFTLAMEKQKENTQKKDILIVCSSGKGSSRLLKYRYQQEFADYLGHIYVCDLIELESFDFSKVEYVFTTVPILTHVPVPILEVGLFLDKKDIKNVKYALRIGETDYIRRYYQEDTFLTGISGGNRYDILRQMCEKIAAQDKVPDNFYELVIQREELASTDYGNLVAVPHPLKTVTEESFVYVTVLDVPLLWHRYEVQVILLTVIGRREDANLQKFYELSTRLIVEQESIQELIRDRSYEKLIELLTRQERQ